MRNRNTIQLLGFWELIYNPNFKPLEFEGFRKQAGLQRFKMTPMKYRILFSILTIVLFSFGGQSQNIKPDYVLAIHGGAGAMSLVNTGPEKQKEYTIALERALAVGDSVLRNNGSSLDAVEACIGFLEDCPLFNAGKGAVFTAEGKNELDASIMNGATLQAGSVAGITTVRHPISAARKVMENSPHVMLTGKGAELFAKEQGLEIVDPSYFRTEQRWKDYEKAKARMDSIQKAEGKHGTVGCVALDRMGNLAAGTSTGGMMMKKYGRVGDSPIIGAGTYADNKSCAISATGHGEFFIRNVVAYDISALMKYKEMSLQEAASLVIESKLKEQGGNGGIIGIDTHGNIAMVFNTSGMFRGWLKSENGRVDRGTAIFR
jgi:beta-aspartyl-peptidase (threonine type)